MILSLVDQLLFVCNPMRAVTELEKKIKGKCKSVHTKIFGHFAKQLKIKKKYL